MSTLQDMGESKLMPAHIAEGIRRFHLRLDSDYPNVPSAYLQQIAAALASSPEWMEEAETMLRTLAKMKRNPALQTQALILQCFAVALEVGRVMGPG